MGEVLNDLKGLLRTLKIVELILESENIKRKRKKEMIYRQLDDFYEKYKSFLDELSKVIGEN